MAGWLVALRIYVISAVFQPYRDLEAENNKSLKIQVARPGIELRSSCSESQELNHSATATPKTVCEWYTYQSTFYNNVTNFANILWQTMFTLLENISDYSNILI